MLQKNSEDEESSDDTLGRPLLAASNIDPVSINFLCQRGIEEPRGWIVSILSPVRLLSLNVRFCFNEPGYTLCTHRCQRLATTATFLREELTFPQAQ